MSGEMKAGTLCALIGGARSGRISRRAFMERALAGGMTVAAAGVIWSRDVRAATPKSGGTFRVGLHDSNTSDSLDPALTDSEFTLELIPTCTERLKMNCSCVEGTGCEGEMASRLPADFCG